MRPLRVAAIVRAQTVLEADLCSAALVAAEIVAAGLGNPCRGLPESAQEWMEAKHFVPTDKHVQAASSAVDRIGKDSELADLWKGDRAWKAGIRRLLHRLGDSATTSQPARPLRPKQKREQKHESPSEGTVTLAAIRRIARKRRGGLAIVERKPYYLGLEGSILSDLVSVTKCAECQSLAELDISGRGITDRWMVLIGHLPNLESLNIEPPNVTDAGLAHLKSLSKLERLTLRRVKITDEGLQYLTGLKTLSRLSVHGTEVTPKGLTSIWRRLNCEVISDCLRR